MGRMAWENLSSMEGVGSFQPLCLFVYTAANRTDSDILDMPTRMHGANGLEDSVTGITGTISETFD